MIFLRGISPTNESVPVGYIAVGVWEMMKSCRNAKRSQTPQAEGVDMNKDQVAGRAKEVAGKTKAAIGNMANKPGTEVKGRVEQAAGKAQASYGDAKDKAKKHS